MTPLTIYTTLQEYHFQHRHDFKAAWEDFTALQERRRWQASYPRRLHLRFLHLAGRRLTRFRNR